MSTIRESELFPLLKNLVRQRNPEIVRGVSDQDDAAIIRVSDSTEMIIASDFVRGTGFHLFVRGLLSHFDVGYYLVAANVSDMAAMGGRATGILSVIRYSKEMPKDAFAQVMSGIECACDAFSCTLVGGDSGSYNSDVLAATAFGFLPKGTALERRNFQSGQALFVSGSLGTPIAALQYFTQAEKGTLSADIEDELLNSWKRPKPRIDIAEMLRDSGFVSGCMDISDGLTASLVQLRNIIGCGARIYENNIPISRSSCMVSQVLGLDKYELSLGASVDFQLLFSVPESDIEKFQHWAKAATLDVVMIGELLNTQEFEYIRKDGTIEKQLPGVPWDHQTEIISDVFAKKHD